MWVLPGRESRDGGLGRGRGAHVRGAGYLDRFVDVLVDLAHGPQKVALQHLLQRGQLCRRYLAA